MNNNDINKKLEALISGMNGSEIAGSKQTIQQFLNSPQGKKLASSLSDADKKKIINKFMSMSNADIQNKLRNTNRRDLSNISIDEILKKLR